MAACLAAVRDDGGLFLVLGILYYVIAVRGKAHDVEGVDPAGRHALGPNLAPKSSGRRPGADRSPISGVQTRTLHSPAMTDAPDVLRGELADELTAALQRVPEIADRELTLTTLSGGITNRNFLITAAGTDERWVIRLAGNDTHLLGISREVEHAATVAAAGVGVGPEVAAFIRPEGYLVTRFIVGVPVSDTAVHQTETLERVADSHPPGPRWPGHPRSVHPAAHRRGAISPWPPAAACLPAGWDRAAAIGKQVERALLRGAAAVEPVPQRPAERELHR